MKMRKVGIALVVAAAVWASWMFFVRDWYNGATTSTSAMARTSQSAVPSATAVRDPSPIPGNSADPDPSGRLSDSKDYFELVSSLIVAARDGDHSAQYSLSKALKYCDDGYRFYFERRGHRRTLDQAMQWASTRPDTSVEEVRAIHARCQRLKEGDASSDQFGSAAEWLEQAVKGGVALAQVDKAKKLMLEAGVSGRKEHLDMRNEARGLAVEALRSKDPSVVWEMGNLATLLAGDFEKAEKEQWVWRVAACQRGYDCGPQAEWLQFACRFDANCQPYESGIDFIRREKSADFEEIERRATELNAKLDTNNFEDLGTLEALSPR